MSYAIAKVEVWAGDIANRPGMLARLLEALAAAGAQLEFLVARRVTERTSRVFVAPLRGKRQTQAARDVGLVPATGLQTIRVEGPDRPGLGAELTRLVAAAGINIRGASAAALGRRSAFYMAFSSADEARAAVKALRRSLSRR